MRQRLEKWFWEQYARWYIQLNVLQPYQDLVNRQEELIRGLVEGNRVKRILDAGCGTANLLVELGKMYPSWQFDGIDRSSAMLAVARPRVSSNVMVHQHDMSNVFPFDAAAFDATVSSNALYTVHDPAFVLKEIRRVLKPGGHFILVNPWLPKQRFWGDHVRYLYRSRDHRAILQTVRHAHVLALIYALNVYIARRAKYQTFHFLPPTELARRVEEAGFRILSMDDTVYSGTCVLIHAVVV